MQINTSTDSIFSKNHFDLPTIIALLLFVAYKLSILFTFSFIYTDSDQSVLWSGALDYSQGLFYEPRFYGQDYNTMLESFLAVPLIWFDLPVNQALPITTLLLSLLPFVLLFIVCKRALNVNLLILPFVLCLLPIEYDLICSLPRGFVTGIAVASISFLGIDRNTFFSFLSIGFISAIAFSINPNSIILSFTIVLYSTLQHLKNSRYYVGILVGSGIGLLIHFGIDWFYTLHPTIVMHSYSREFDFVEMLNGLNNLDAIWKYITPIFWGKGVVIPILFIGLAITFFYQKKKQMAIVSFFSLLFIILLFIFPKAQDGNLSIFFSKSRLYLAVPIVISFLCLKIQWGSFLKYLPAILIAAFIFKLNVLDDTVKKRTAGKKHVVTVIENEAFCEQCKNIKHIAQKENASLIVIRDHWNYDLYNYGCRALVDSFPNTIRPDYERRIWRLREEEKLIHPTTLLITMSEIPATPVSKISKTSYSFIYKVENTESLSFRDLMQDLGVSIRKY